MLYIVTRCVKIQAPGGLCRFRDVSISSESVSPAYQARVDTDRQIAAMKKARDVQEDTAEALVELVKQAPMPDHVGTRLNVVA